MHLVGVKEMTVEQLKSYHSSRYDSICPGHPEIENDGVEVTTGPLGQGVANAVGLAIATKQLASTYNRDGHELVNNMTYVSHLLSCWVTLLTKLGHDWRCLSSGRCWS
jgi:dihydroxyacetone synthase